MEPKQILSAQAGILMLLMGTSVLCLSACDRRSRPEKAKEFAGRLNPASVMATNGQAVLIHGTNGILAVVPRKLGNHQNYSIQIFFADNAEALARSGPIISENVRGNKDWEIHGTKFFTGWGTPETTSVSLRDFDDGHKLAILESTNFASLDLGKLRFVTNNPPVAGDLEDLLKR